LSSGVTENPAGGDQRGFLARRLGDRAWPPSHSTNNYQVISFHAETIVVWHGGDRLAECIGPETDFTKWRSKGAPGEKWRAGNDSLNWKLPWLHGASSPEGEAA
jgi:hypothetical protein